MRDDQLKKVDVVVKAVCEVFGSTPKRVLSPVRGSPVEARIRQIAMHVYRSLPNESWSSTGRAFDRDRTTVRHNVDRVNALLTDLVGPDLVLADQINNVMALVRNRLK